MQVATPTPRNHEIKLGEEEFIVSKTDTKGKITYVNRVFMRIAGYSESELLGQPHNIIRHPDMPRGAFKLMWDTLQKGEEFFGYVKNLSKDGSYYWVLANVTPVYSPTKKLMGYYSVRRKPQPKAIEKIIPIYKAMCDIEKGETGKTAVDKSVMYLEQQLQQLDTDYLTLILSLENEETAPWA